MNDISLTWTLTKSDDGKRLLIEYEITNTSKGPVFVADRLLAYHEKKIQLVPSRVIVTAGPDDAVRFVRGIVKTRTTQFDHPPGAERLEPGAKRAGKAEVSLPLVGWHNYHTPPAIPKSPTEAVLEIAYLTGDAIEWAEITTADGTKVTVPQLPSFRKFSKTVVSERKPLP